MNTREEFEKWANTSNSIKSLEAEIAEARGYASMLEEKSKMLEAENAGLRNAAKIAIAEMGKCVDEKDCCLDTAIEALFIAMEGEKE